MKQKTFFRLVILSLSVSFLHLVSCKQEDVHYKDEIIYVGDNPVSDSDKKILCDSYEMRITYEKLGTVGVFKLSEIDAKLSRLSPIKTYHLEEKQEGQGFVSVEFFFKLLEIEGQIKSPNFKYNLSKNTLTVSYVDINSYNQSAVFDWVNNTVTLSTSSFSNFFSNDTHPALKFWPEYFAGGKKMVFDLGKYNFDILYYDGSCLIPFYIGQLLLMSDKEAPIYFMESLGERIYICDCKSMISAIYKSENLEEFQKKDVPSYIREDTWNSLMFIMDNFYGLRENRKEKLGSETALFSDFQDTDLKEYKDAILSTDKREFTEGLCKFISGYIDEGHSSIKGFSCHVPKDIASSINPNDFDGPRGKKLISTLSKFSDMKENTIYTGAETPGGEPVYYSSTKKTAFINFNGFQGDEDENLPGTIPFFKKTLLDISKNPNVENIVLDLTTNGGGSIFVCNYILGMMTNKTVTSFSLNRQNDTVVTMEWKSDTTGEGVFDENDGYPNYNWYALTSGFSFSCGNALPTMMQFSGLGKVIGQPSGGGICSVGNAVLADGSTIGYSSSTVIAIDRINETTGEREYYFNEKGVTPDILLSDEEFYCDDWPDFLEAKLQDSE